MAVILKSPHEIEKMRDAGLMVAETFAYLQELVVPGVTTLELDRRAEEFIRRHGARPMYKGYHPPGHNPFPATICVAVNDAVVHGIPSRREHLHAGDIIGIDIGLLYRGWVGDACRTYGVGAIDVPSQRLITAAEGALMAGVAAARVGNRLGDIGAAIQRHVEARGYSIVRELCGHGVGRSLWEEPQVLHFGDPGKGKKLRRGMVFTIEPMINAGAPDVVVLQDGWTIVTADGSRSAQFEHTVAITDQGTRILTAPSES